MLDFLVRIMADGLVIPIILLGVWALIFKVPANSRYQSYARILMAGLTAYLFAKLIANIFQPELERPFEVLGHQAGALYLNNPGFPSDHLLFCTAITLAVWFETRMKKLSVTLAVLTLLVAVGRVLALVHTPLDVVGGIVIASLGALWYLQREPHATTPYRKQWSKPRKTDKIA
jgi:membrane-associated phospholipid phosphatase